MGARGCGANRAPDGWTAFTRARGEGRAGPLCQCKSWSQNDHNFRKLTRTGDFLKLHFAGQTYESFVVMYLDAQHRLIAVEDLFRGTLTQTSVYPREIARRALHHNAAALVVAHNHPSGVAEPSRADEPLTNALKNSLSLLDVRVLDHLVIAGSQATSLAQRGLM